MNKWLTPNAAGGQTARRVLVIPVELETSVNGALQELGEAYNWEPFGTMTPDEAAALIDVMLQDYYMSIVGDDIGGRNQVLAPWSPSAFSDGWNWAPNANANAGGYWQCNNAAPINNHVEWQLQLPPGDYKVKTVMRAGTDCGDYTVKMDGTTIENISAYSPTSVQNAIFTTQQFTITEGGQHELRYTVIGKQPSATAYRIFISAISVEWQP